MTEGYVYCFSNPSMPGILKIGMTERTPEARLLEANASDTWKPPTPYTLVFAKKVSTPLQKERALHALLEKYAERIHSRREFFRVSPEDVLLFLDLMDGTMWVPDADRIMEVDAEQEEKYADTPSHNAMATWFVHGQPISHIIGRSKLWSGTYDSTQNGIVCNGVFYRSLDEFAIAHYRAMNSTRCKPVDGWKECFFEVDGTWISTNTLPK